MSASPEFRRVISRRSLVQPALLPITGSALVSGLMLALLLLLGGALAWMLVDTSRQLLAGSDSGLFAPGKRTGQSLPDRPRDGRL